jgi:plasmid stabilization system protein ParE
LIVIWQPEAVADIETIIGGRAGWSEDSALQLAAAIIARADQITDFPRSGRMIPEFQMEHLREVLEQGFRILYEVFPGRIEVFGVVSSRQDAFPDTT